MKKITLFIALFFAFLSQGYGQFTQGFDSGINGGWTVINGGDANTWVQFTTPTVFVISGTASATITYSATAHDDYLVSPAITVTAGVNDRFSFKARSFDPLYPEDFDLVVSTTTPTAGAFTTTIANIAPDSSLSTATDYSFDLSAYVGQTIYIAMHSTTTDMWRISVDDVVNDAYEFPCLSNTFQFPAATIVTGICDGFTPTTISTCNWAGDYAVVSVTAGETYIFDSNYFSDGSPTNDFLTISTDGNATSAAFGVAPLTWVSDFTGDIWLNFNTDSATCGTEDVCRVSTVICGVPCLNGTLWPTATFTATTCDGLTPNDIVTDGYAGEYSNVTVFNLGEYTFSSSVATDYITITSADASTIYAAGTGSVTWLADADQVVRFYTHLDAACGTEAVNRTRTVVCTAPVALPNCIDTPPVFPLDGAIDAPAFSDITLTWNAPSTGEAPTSYNLYVGFAPGSLTLAANVGDVLSVNAGSVGAYDTTIYWMAVPVNAAGEAIGCTDTEWSFTTESAPAPPVNDLCDGAIDLTVGATFADNSIIGTNAGATDSGVADPACSSYLGGDVWYTVVVPASGNVTIETQSDDDSITDTGVAVYTGDCVMLAEYDCDDDAGVGFFSLVQINALTPGQTLYVRVFAYGNAEVGAFQVSAYDPLPISNDDFANATAISCGNTYTGDTSTATLDEDNAPDGFGADLDAPNVWFSYTGSGFAETITLNLCGSSYDTSVLVYTGTSGNLTLVAANDDDNTCVSNGLNSKVTFNSDGTTTYYVTVEGYNVGSVGAFTMAMTCTSVNPPAVTNQDCGTALDVLVNGADNASDNSYGTINALQPTCDQFNAIQDVWFSFVAPASGLTDVLVTPGSMTSANFLVYSGACGSLTPYGLCNSNYTTPYTENLTGLMAGTTYYIQVWSNTSEQGTFTLRLSDPGLANSTFDSSEFTYYPNPVKDVLNIEYSENITNVQVVNILGQQVIAKSLNVNQTQIDMSALPAGTYLVKITADNKEKTIKVLKQ